MPGRQQSGHVFQEAPLGLHFSNDTNGVRPAISFVQVSRLFSCDRERLAREAARDASHDATPFGSVKGSHIVPDGRVVEHSVGDSCFEHVDAVRLSLDVADGSVSEEVLTGKQSASRSGK